MQISLIVAISANNVIGKDNQLPWRLPADMKNFKQVTMGKPVIMGRNTYESIGKPLPGRTNIVITSKPDYEAKGCTVVHSLDTALAEVSASQEVMFIGGSTLYHEALPIVDRIYLTLIHSDFEGDTFFPHYNREQWHEVSRENFQPDEANPYPFSFIVMDRQDRHRKDG